MIYLDNAATTFPKPECVYDKVNTVQRTIAVNVGRGGYSVASEAMQIVDETRVLMASFVGAAGPECVVFAPSATIAANEIIYGLEWDSYKNVYITPFEHNAIARPLNTISDRYGVKVRLLPFDSQTQSIDMASLEQDFAMNPPDYVFMNHVSNVTGAIIPIKTIAEKAKEYSSVVIVDGSQSVGILPLSLKETAADFLIFAGHKNLYSSWGIGGFITNTDYKLRPVLAGGTGSDSLNLKMANDYPGGFELGSPNIIAIASLNESLKWLNKVGIGCIEEKKNSLTQKLIGGLLEAGATMYLPSGDAKHTSVVSFNIPGYEPNEVGIILSEDFDIAVRTGFHCAPFIHKLIGSLDTHGTVRVSVGDFNTEADIDALIAAITNIMGDQI